MLAEIEQREIREGSSKRLWKDAMTLEQVLSHLRQLKYWVKRIEYKAEDEETVRKRILANYSPEAFQIVRDRYGTENGSANKQI